MGELYRRTLRVDLMEKTYHASANPKEHFLTGISMGGMEARSFGIQASWMVFGGIAALEAGIEPMLHWKDMRAKDRFYRDDSLFESAFGKPVDPAYWEANNPASVAKADPQRLIRSGLKIYFDAAGHDMFFLYEGNEFLHRPSLFDGRRRGTSIIWWRTPTMSGLRRYGPAWRKPLLFLGTGR